MLAQTADRVKLKLLGVPQTIKPGKTFNARLVAKIDDGWHVYSLTKIPGGPIPTQIILAKGQPFKLAGEIVTPTPRVDRDSAFGVEVEFYEGKAEFTLPIKVAPKTRPGTRKLEVSVRFQVCSGEMCLRPQIINLNIPIIVSHIGLYGRRQGD